MSVIMGVISPLIEPITILGVNIRISALGMGMGFGMQNMPMPMQNPVIMPMGMQNGNPFMGMNNVGINSQEQDQEWMKGFTLGVQEVNSTSGQNNDGGLKINAIFTTTKGTKTIMLYDYGTTIDQAIQKYLERMNHLELYTTRSNKICFLFNGAQLKYGDQTKVEEYFKNNSAPKIIVNDVHELIGA